MRRAARKQFLALFLVLAMLAGLGVPALAAEGEKTVTILQTSDLHGMVNPFDHAPERLRRFHRLGAALQQLRTCKPRQKGTAV